jgi:endo-1,4-beta-xylanase
VEIYVDGGNAKNGGYRADDTQIRVSAQNAVSFGTGDEAAQRARLASATTPTDGGYRVEASVDLLSYGGAGTFHGLDFQVNDAADGARTAVRNWADPTGAGYQSTARWGVGQLVEPEAPAVPAWSAGTVYTAGDQVSHDGAVFTALWWTRDQRPGATPWGPWAEVGAQVTCAAGPEAAWTRSWEYRGGETVSHEGHRWTARWYSRNQEPGFAPWGPWQDLGVC